MSKRRVLTVAPFLCVGVMKEFIKLGNKREKRLSNPLEKDIEKECCAHARSLGIAALKLALIGLRGFPDRTLLVPQGKVIFVEFKRDSNCKLSPSQEKYKELLERLGFKYYVVYSLEQFKDILWIYQ